MSTRPSLTIVGQMPRHRQTLSDQLVLGLVTGGLFGPGLLIAGREADCIRFRKLGGVLRAAPDRGEILLGIEPSGETRVECRIWCRGLVLRRLVSAALIGASMVGLLAAGLWVLNWVSASRWDLAAGGGLLTALVAFAIGRWVDRARLRRQVRAFLHNTTYLKAV